MGVETGGGGRVPRSRKISGGMSPRNDDIYVPFFLTHENFAFSTIFEFYLGTCLIEILSRNRDVADNKIDESIKIRDSNQNLNIYSTTWPIV